MVLAKLKTLADTTMAIAQMRNASFFAKNNYESQYDLPNKLKKMAEFASHAYKQTDTVRGYKRDKSLSNKRFSVYVKGDKIILAVRGTADLVDALDDDKDILMGKQHKRIQENHAVLDAIEKKYPDARIEQAGHSLGGLTIAATGSERGIRSYSFNPGSSAFGGEKYQDFLKKSFDSDHVITTVREGDIVSASMMNHARKSNLHVVKSHDKDLKKL